MSLKGILGGIDVDVILNSIVHIRARLGFSGHIQTFRWDQRL